MEQKCQIQCQPFQTGQSIRANLVCLVIRTPLIAINRGQQHGKQNKSPSHTNTAHISFN